MNVNIFIALCSWYSVSAQFETTTKTYDIHVPGSDPIRIVEGEPLWSSHATTQPPERKKIQHRALKIQPNAFTTDKTKTNLNNPVEDDSGEEEENASEEFHPGSLKEFLDSYAEKLKQNKPQTSQEEDEYDSATEDNQDSVSGDEKSKSWDLLNLQKHDHPYEDKSGWVSLEPVPWSISKISKWQSNYKQRPVNSYSQDRPWHSEDSNDRVWNSNSKPYQDRYSDNYDRNKPQYSPYTKPYESEDSLDNPYKFNNKIGIRDNYDVYYVNKPNLKPAPAKPTAIYAQKVQIQTPSYGSEPQRPHFNKIPYRDNNYKHEEPCNHGDIITDRDAPEFPAPHFESNRRQGTEIHPESHPFSGQGDWVLLSTTKGYKFSPSRQRSLKIDPDSIGAHRSVRLTVLPPLKNSRVNMTTSHGGLLQVESTFQTVEQAHREFTKKQRMKQKRKKRPQKASRPTKNTNTKVSSNTKRPAHQASRPRPAHQAGRPSKQVVKAATITANRRNTGPDSSSILAAVGAGMIPATMAMLVPLALNGRRKRDLTFVTSKPVSPVEMTLRRNI